MVWLPRRGPASAAFDASQLMAEDAGSERDVRVRPFLEIESLGMLVRRGVQIGGARDEGNLRGDSRRNALTTL
jgi:hypothetical protein